MSRAEHKDRYFSQAGTRLRLPAANGTAPRGTKGFEDGRYTEGVLRYHDHWFNTVPCERMGSDLTEAVVQQRTLMQAGVALYCAADKKRFCPRSKPRPPPPKPASYFKHSEVAETGMQLSPRGASTVHT